MKLFTFTGKVSLRIPAILLALLISSSNSFSQQAWTQVPSPDISATRNMIRGISGTSSSDVWAVGDFEETYPSTIQKNLVMHWNGSGGWQIMPIPNQSGPFGLDQLWDVEALSANDVWAAGDFNYPDAHSALFHWNGSNWSPYVLPVITGGSGLWSLDAIAANDIWAVGFAAGSPTSPCYAIHYNGSSWTQVPVPAVGTFYNRFKEVDGLTTNDVWAVGNKANAYGNFFPLAMHWNGSVWANVALPASINTVFGELQNIKMVSANDVWATGSTITALVIKIHWDGTTWTDVSGSAGGGGGIAARSANDVFVLGNKISHWNGSTWTVIDSLTQLSYPALGSTVKFANGDIWSGGRTWTPDNVFHTLVYRTANDTPHFTHGITQTLNTAVNSNNNPIDTLLRVQDADISQVVVYTIVTPPSHGSLNGLPVTAITSGGFATPSGVSYTPTAGYIGTDNFVIRASVGPLVSQSSFTVNVVIALPIVLTDYTVSKVNNTVVIQWTSIEQNTEKYVIERSSNGINFSFLNSVNAQGNIGNNHYKITDRLPLIDWNYYRLKSFDKDARITLFPVKALKFEGTELDPAVVYPNPVIGKVMNIYLNKSNDEVWLSIFNQMGQKVFSTKMNHVSGLQQVVLPQDFLTGIYLLNIQTITFKQTQRIFIK